MGIEPEHIAIFIPIIVVLGGVLVAITAVIIHGRNKDLEHRERITAMEKGIELPVPTPQTMRPVHSAKRAWGLVLVGVGLAVTIAIWTVEGAEGGVWGFIPLFMGVALLVAAMLDKKEYDEEKGASETSPTTT